MSGEAVDVLALLENLVNSSAERERFEANPVRYLADKGLLQNSDCHPGLPQEVSTVIKLSATSQGNHKKQEESLIIGKATLTTESDVLLVEIPGDKFLHSVRAYPLMEKSWISYDTETNNIAFVLYIEFDNAIPQNPSYKPILKVSYQENTGTPKHTPFYGSVAIELKRYLLVKKNCPVTVFLKGSYNASNNNTLEINISPPQAQD